MINKYQKIDLKENLRIYFNFLSKHKFWFIVLLCFATIIEASYTVEKFLFKIVIDKGTEFTGGILALDLFVKILLIITAIFFGLLLIRTFGRWINVHLINMLTSNSIAGLKRKFFNHIVHLSYNFHAGHRSGSLISRLTRGSRALERMNDIVAFNIAPLFLDLFIVGGSLLYFSWIPALVAVITTLVFVTYSLFLMDIQKKARAIANESEDREKGNISDVFMNIESIKYFGKEDYIKSKYSRLVERTKNSMLRAWSYWRWIDSGQAIILGLGFFFMLFFPMIKFLNGEMSIGTIVFIFTVYGNLINPMFMFVHGARGFYESMVDFQELFKYDKIKNEIKDKPNAENIKIKKGEIVFDNVSFKYYKYGLFENFNLKINKNEKVALVGHSGCGKTTLIKLLYRLYDINEGKILIDKEDIRDFKQESLRNELSIVPQECILFNDTIYNNVAFSDPRATKGKIMKAIKVAQLDRVIENMPRKEKTIVGERGVKLSGGEKQRVSIARAILANKKIIVLDEATSSLDSETEHAIQKALSKLLRGRTAIIIAHRLSTIMNADKIVVMKKGKIVQIGKHKDLIKKDGHYQNLWNMQKGGYIK